MGRPSKKAERQEQILDAFGRIVSRYGLAGATQDRVAEEAGLARALIRHNLGNQDAVTRAFVARFLSWNREFLDQLYQSLPPENRLEALIERLFDPEWNDGETTRISEALLLASADDPALKQEMQAWLADIHTMILDVITETHPDSPQPVKQAVGVGLTGIWFNADSLHVLDQGQDHHQASRQAAQLLIRTLS